MKISEILPVVVGVLIALIAYDMVIKKVVSPVDGFEMED
jgi:hypothetical protein